MAQTFQQLFPNLADLDYGSRVPRVDRASGDFLPYKKKKILRYLSEGSNLDTAFVLARVRPYVINTWIEMANAEILSYMSGYDDELGEYSTFVMDMAEAMAKFTHSLQKRVEMLFGVDSKYGPMYLRLLEAAHQPTYGQKQQLDIRKTEVKVTYKVTTTNGDAWKQRALSGSSRRITQEVTEDGTVDGQFVDEEP